MMDRTDLPTLILAALLLGSAAAGQAQQANATPPAVEPAALDALDKMGAYLRTLNSFEVRSDATTDEVLESGQKLQLASTINLRVRRPDRLWAEVASDRKTRELFYDGKTFTIWGPRNKLYASFPAPATLLELVERADDRYGIVLPLADLFRWGTEPTRREAIHGAIHVGPALLGGIPCDHFAFRQEGVDWQVWIQKGDSPLPLKLVITTTGEEAQPQYTSELDWNLAPALNEKMFAFEPPPDSYRISIREITAEPAPGK
jgi:hypothetical protein